jgi:outer membrane protein TolC
MTAPIEGTYASYIINKIPAPQVKPNPLAQKLRSQLSSLKKSIELRSKPTTLNQALEAGLISNPQLAAEYTKIQGQQWDLIAVRRQWFPSLSANSSPYTPSQSFNTTTQSSSPNTTGRQTGTTYTNTSATGTQLTLGWTFFNPSRGPNINAASESLRQQQLLFDVSARNLVLQIQDSYFSLQEQQQLISSYEEILAATTRQVETTEAQFNSGVASIADVEQIRTQQYGTLTTLINAYQQLITSAAQVAKSMALPPGTLVLATEEVKPLGQWDESLQDTIAQALKFREEIQASLAASNSASWSATGLMNNYWPSFSLGASGSFSSLNETSGFPGRQSTTSNGTSRWNSSVGVGFTWQILDGGISAANAESLKAVAQQALDQAAISQLNVTSEVEINYGKYMTNILALQSTMAQATAALSATRAVQERFAAGVTDMASVVQTLTQAITAANAYAIAVRSYNSAVAGLYRSSARWPLGTKTLLQQSVRQLKQR